MSNITFSTLLTKLIASASGIDKDSTMFTAEKFLVTIIDIILDGREEYYGEDFLPVAHILRNSVVNLQGAKDMLMKHICDDSEPSFFDDLYMKNKLREVGALCAEANLAEVSAMALLSSILQKPSEVIKSMLKPEASENVTKNIVMSAIESAKPSDDGTWPYLPKQGEADSIQPKSMKTEMAELIGEVKRIRDELQGAIFGQDNAVNVFATGYFQARMLSMIDRSRKRPCATFLFAGPPGVGKTFLAEKAAEALRLPFMRFDMSEYCDKEAAIEFCGSDSVYKNSKQGNFTSYVSQHPKCVILFDEIEKAHISIIHLFLQILDAGRIRDNQSDKEISLKDTILIFTTNAGKQLYQDSETDLSTVSRKVIIDALEKDVNPSTGVPYFPGAICSRFASGNVVMFNHIGAHDLRHIARREITRHADNLRSETGIEIELDELVYTALLFSEGTKADARTIRSRAEAFFNDELYELLRLVASEKVKTGVDDIEKIKVSVELSGAEPKIAGLFESAEKTRVLLLASEETVALSQLKAPAYKFYGVQNSTDAIDVIKTKDIGLVMLDVQFDAKEDPDGSLNIEDVGSPAREFFRFLKEQKNDVPVYLIEGQGSSLGDEEKASFTRQGVRGILKLTKGRDGFATRLDEISAVLHQQASMLKLAKENKLITFETAQSVSKNGKNASIKLFDFKTVVAVDSEDAKSILSGVSKPNVCFDDVIGAREAKTELKYFVEYLKNPKKYMGTGVKAPKGVILYGPPGTGKTMLARAMACEADVTFIAAEGNQFLKRYVGEGNQAVHELFNTARKYAPAIIFVDEIDAIAKERKGGENSYATGEDVLTAFLAEMDGFASDPSKPVFVLAATNFDIEPGRAKSLDPALMRRFDRRVYIGLPDKADRIRFLNKKIQKNRALDISEMQVDNIAMRATGMSLAQLDSVVELALRSAIRQESVTVTDAILEEAFETFNNGEVKKWDITQLERVARHEAGHALLCYLGGETPSYLTIVARGDHGGYMQHAEQEGKAIYTKDELLARIRTSLGGRAAEIVYYGEQGGISTGASGDLASATSIAHQIVCAYGMDDEFGLAVFGGDMTPEVRGAVNRILKEEMAKAITIISENKSKLDALVNALMAKNHLTGEEIEAVIFGGCKG